MSAPRQPDPIQWVGGYSLDAYCDRALPQWEHLTMAQGYGRTHAEAKRELVQRGWRFNPDGTCTCPVCVKAGAPRVPKPD